MDAQQISAAVIDAFNVAEPPDLTTVHIGADYRQNHAQGPAGIRDTHALTALQSADAVQCFAGDKGSAHTLAIKRVITVGKPFTMLLEVNTRQDGQHLTGAWRVYDAPEEATPLDLFADLVASCGTTVTIGGLVEDNFVARLTVPTFTGDPSQLFGFKGKPEGRVSVSMGFRMEPGGDAFIEWAYGLDASRYERRVAQSRN